MKVPVRLPSGPELSIPVTGRVQLAGQVYRGIRQAILEDRLRAGEQVPASRELARQLGISRNTVLAAYGRLESEGYLHSVAGSGTYVTESGDGAGVVARRSTRQGEPPRLSRFASRLTHPAPIVPHRDLPYDFRPGVPELGAFPLATWRRLTAHRLQRLSGSIAYYGDPSGHLPLRAAIARHFGHSRALRCTADDIVVVSGSQQALDLVGRVVIEPGSVVAVEDPGYPAALAVFRALGARVVPIRVDGDGIRVEDLPADVRLIYVTPSHQFPLGVTLSLARRRALLECARQRRAVIIEDDYDSEFRYAGRPLDSLQGLDESGVVVYLGTFSKVLFPGLRLGYIAAAPSLRAPLLAAKWLTDRHSEAVEQHVMADFIDEGHFAQHIRRMRSIYAERQAVLVEALRSRLPWIVPLPAVAGLHLTALLPERFPTDELIARAAATGVGLYSIAPFFHGAPFHGTPFDGTPRPGLMFGFGGCPANEIAEGIRRVANVHRSMRARPPRGSHDRGR